MRAPVEESRVGPVNMPPKGKAPKRETAIVKYDPARPHYVYEGLDPETGAPFYVGRTGDVLRRGLEVQNELLDVRSQLDLVLLGCPSKLCLQTKKLVVERNLLLL